MIARTWLCLPNKSSCSISNSNAFNSVNLAFILFNILSSCVIRTHAAQSLPRPSDFNASHSVFEVHKEQAKSLNSSGDDVPMVTHKNTLTDELGTEEFIDSESRQPHSRKKRLIWITDDGRLALPPGTSLTFTPTIALPLVRHPPEGFFSNMSISFPVTIDFDKLGLTDNQNPLGDLPPIFGRSFGHLAGEMVGNYVARYLHYKRKRDLDSQTQQDGSVTPATTTTASYSETNGNFQIKRDPLPSDTGSSTMEFPQLPERFKHIFHGGERVMLYGVVEDFLSTFGMNGKACLLRTICEVHSRNLEHYGVFGEMVKLFLTVTKSPFADLIPEYVQAQETGEGHVAPGECFPYNKECPKSIFKALQSHQYSEYKNSEYHEEAVQEILPEREASDAMQQAQFPKRQYEKKLNLKMNAIKKANKMLYEM